MRTFRQRRHQRGQAMVEFALVFPVFLALVFGSIIVYGWQLDVDSAQFAAEEGIQVAAFPAETKTLLCDAEQAAWTALNTKSFLDKTPLAGSPQIAGKPLANTQCGPGIPDYTPKANCPPAAGGGNPGLQTYSSMLNYLKGQMPASTNNIAMVCAVCIDLSQANTPPCLSVTVQPADQVELQITVVGYKSLPVAVPIFGTRIPFYGQNSQTIQAFSQ